MSCVYAAVSARPDFLGRSWPLYPDVLCWVWGHGVQPSACRSSSFQLQQATAHPVPLVAVACLEQRLGFPCASTKGGEGDAVFLGDDRDKVHLVSCSVSQSRTRRVTQMLHGGCPSEHSCVFPAGLGRWPTSCWRGKMFLQTLPQDALTGLGSKCPGAPGMLFWSPPDF